MTHLRLNTGGRRRLAGLLIIATSLAFAVSLVRAPVAHATVTSVNDHTTGTGQNQFDYHGTWTYETDAISVGAYMNDDTYSNTTNDYYLVRFTGTGITLFDVLSSGSGQASAAICDSNTTNCGTATTFSDYSATRIGNQQVYIVTGLSNTTHSLKITVTGVNAAAGSHYVDADQVVIDDSSGARTAPLLGPIRWDAWWQDNNGVTNPYLSAPIFTDYTYL